MMWDAELMLRMVRYESAERIRSAEQRRLVRTVLPSPERDGDKPKG